MRPEPWSDAHDAYLRETICERSSAVARALGRTQCAIEGRRRKLGLYVPKPVDQLCWHCARATNARGRECPWVRDGTPVPGWSATRTHRRHTVGDKVYKDASYKIIACPLYQKDHARRR